SKQGITPAILAGIPAEILLQRPDVIAAEQRLIAANANIGAARAAFFPRIALTGNIGVASRDLGGLFDSGSNAWSFQPIITLPLFTGGRGTANVNLAEARKVIAIAEYEKTIQLAFREVADLLNASETLTRQLTAQTANAAAQKQRLRLVEARFSAGVANYLEVLDAQREAYSAEQGEVQVRRSWLSVATQLFKALAGNNVMGMEKIAR
ncbi:MAG: TolC family protein, partial [Candidatus Nitrotoga sp.]